LYESKVSRGYYGEEFDGVVLDESIFSPFLNNLITILSFNTSAAKIESLLKLEYGEVLPQFKDLDWELENVALNKIKFLQHQLDIAKKENAETPYPLDAITQPVLCLEHGDSYKLADGYHRLEKKLSEGEETTPILCGKKRYKF